VPELIADLPKTDFRGYLETRIEQTGVVAIIVDGQSVETADAGQDAVVILDRTPFYAESGGQVGDTGRLEGPNADFEVQDTRKLAGVFHGHVGRVQRGALRRGQRLAAQIDVARRARIIRHHSATHLLHAALRQVLGEHVQQKGSLVAADRLRFDFSHHQPLSADELNVIERLVNEQIQANAEAEAREMSFDDAMEAGALAFFGDKYGERVRVLKFGDFSVELCGGTHIERLGDIGLVKIIAESGISAGVRRIEAVAGPAAVDWMQSCDVVLRELSERLKASPEHSVERVDQLLVRSRELEKEVERLNAKLASAAGNDLTEQAIEIGGVRVIAAQLRDIDPGSLRDTVDQLKNKLGSGVVVLGTKAGAGVRLVAGVTDDLTDRLRAGDIVNWVASQVGGRGGGRADFAQAGGSDPQALPAALESLQDWLADRLG